MEKVSIIIPVYNTGNYLYRCVNSIVNQTYHNIEIIIIDDGSQFETANICDQIATSDNRIRLIHKKNEGVSVARNTGLNLVTGKYIGFVDSDDWIDSNMIKTLVHEMESHNADITMCDATTIWDNGKYQADTFHCLPQSCTLDKLDITPKRLLELAGSSCRVLYNTKLLINNNIIFPVGLKFSEDRIFNMIALGYCSKVRYIKKSFYNRYMRKGSCVMSYHNDYTEVALRVNTLMKDILIKHWNKNYIEVFEERNLKSIGYNAVSIFNIKNFSYKERIKTVKSICDNKMLQLSIPSSTKILTLKYIKQKNIFGLYLLSLIENIKRTLKIIINR